MTVHGVVEQKCLQGPNRRLKIWALAAANQETQV